jgi:hypothetical protein
LLAIAEGEFIFIPIDDLSDENFFRKKLLVPENLEC